MEIQQSTVVPRVNQAISRQRPTNQGLVKTVGWLIFHAWIVFHFAAVILAPASMPPSSSLAQASWQYCGGYLQCLFLNHGYHYFAPEPAGASLISYEATMPDGSVRWNRIPNHEIWPRLNYHRHLMLTEHMAVSLQQQPDLESLFVQTYGNEIARQTGATEVLLSHVRHDLSTPEQVRAGRRLDDPVTYNGSVLGTFPEKQLSGSPAQATVAME